MFLDKLIKKSAAYVCRYAEQIGKSSAIDLVESMLGYRPTYDMIEQVDGVLLQLNEDDDLYDDYMRHSVIALRNGLSEFGRAVCEFALFFALYPEVLRAIGNARTTLTVENALKFLDIQRNVTDDYLGYLEQYERLTRLLITDPREKNFPFFKRGLSMDARYVDLICAGVDTKKGGGIYRLSTDVEIKRQGDVHSAFIEQMEEALSAPNGFFHLIGQDNEEMLYIVTLAGLKNELDFLTVDFDRLYKEYTKDEAVLWSVKRELIFNEVALVIHNITAPVEEDEERAAFCLKTVKEFSRLYGAPICLISDKTVSLTPYIERVLTVLNLPDYSRSERIELFSYYAKRAGVEKDIDCTDLASKYKLSREQTKKAIAIIAASKDRGERFIAEACNCVIPSPRQGNITKINATYTLDQLKLHPRQRTAIENIIDHVRYRYKVYDGWGMEKKYAYGKNVAALLVGPPGTGKTMAVHVMSNMLNLPLYSINLSQVVDKYIGETEKRLEEIFETAEKSNVILFFDEADSIFGKRGEVNDSKDRYANTEVSYILQRLEQYEGIVILATNLKKNIDDAFMRRMRYIVEFPQPTQELRLEIWRSVFAPEVPLGNVDLEFLAEQFELTGGSIKNIALNATFLAASDNRPVGIKDILLSIRNENSKLGKTMLLHDFDKYAVLMADVI